MTDTWAAYSPASDIFDLYGEVAVPDPPLEEDPVTNIVQRVGRSFGAICAMFAISLTAFIVCVTLFSLGAGLAVIVVGLFVLVACLLMAGWHAHATRSLLAWAGVSIPPPYYPPSGPGFVGRTRRLRSGQAWRDLLHVLVNFVLSIVSFSLAVTWLAAGPGGLTYWFWSRALPESTQGLPWLLGFPSRFADVAFNTVAGAIFLVTTPAVVIGLLRLHGAVARGLLVDPSPALRQQVSDLTLSRTAAGDAELNTLRRLERDLHDGPQQRLVRLGMDISAAQRRLKTHPDQANELLGEAFQQSQDALAEIRTLSRGIAPPILVEHGLAAAVTALAARGSIPTSVDVAPVSLFEAALNAAYFVVAEALTNVEKHSGASAAAIEIGSLGRVVVVSVSDNGGGGASLAKGHGLAGLADRLAGVDGSLVVSSPAGGPTSVTATLPSSTL
jgi:signal transduction histidine kinase